MKLILFAVLFILFFAWLIREIEKRGVYMPTKKVVPPPAGWEEVDFQTEDGKTLFGWFVPAPSNDGAPTAEARFTFLYFHGNAGNVGHRIEKLKMLASLPARIFIIDYRGYGKSEGAPGERGVERDALAAYRYLTEERKYPADSIIVYGESLGAAVAVDLAQKKSFGGLILEGGFTSVEAIAHEIPPFNWLPSFFFSNKFDSLSKIGRAKMPKLILHSENDEIIPFAMGRKLFGAAKEPKRFAALAGGHNSAFFESGAAYLDAIRSFLGTL